jgi:hypothetical protein
MRRATEHPGGSVGARRPPPARGVDPGAASPRRRRLLGRLALAAGALALWPSESLAAMGPLGPEPGGVRRAAGELPPTFAPPARPLDRTAALAEARAVVARQAGEVGASPAHVARVAAVAERTSFQDPYEFLVTSYFERDPDRRDALLALYARDPRAAVRELGPAFPSPRAEMILATLAYYDIEADRVRVNLGRVTETDATRVLVHELWHALPDVRTWRDGAGLTHRATGFWSQARRPGAATWEAEDDPRGLPYAPYLLNEALAARMEAAHAGPPPFTRPDLEAASGFLARLIEAAGPQEVMRTYLASDPAALRELARRHRAAVPEIDAPAGR